ncbi:MAG: GNAT family N-acetyltransferase [Cyanobacteria bacterium P01_D01_bin.73]
MGKRFSLRAMSLGDVDQVVELYAQVYSADYISFSELAAGLAEAPGVISEEAMDIFQDELIEILTESPAGNFVAIEKGEIVGFVMASVEEADAGHMECWINDMGVSPKLQGQSLGKQLVDAVVDWGKNNKVKYFLLESGFNNKKSHEFFEDVGFKPMATVFHLDARS